MKIAIVVHMSFHIVVLQRTARKCTKIQTASAELLFCSIKLLFGDDGSTLQSPSWFAKTLYDDRSVKLKKSTAIARLNKA